MRRREFIAALGGSAAVWPLAARAQQPAMPVVGYLDIYAPEPTGIFLAAFRKGLSEAGYLEGRNVAIEYRYANSNNDRLPELASDLIRRGVAVIVAPFGTAAVRAAKRATTTIPIVFVTSGDPVQDGLVASFNRPGGIVTGLSTMSVELGGKRLGLLHELIPRALRIVALINPNSAIAEPLIREAQAGASTIGWQVDVVYASTIATLMRPLQAWSKSGPARYSLALSNSSPAVECSSPLLRRTIGSPQSIRTELSQRSAA